MTGILSTALVGFTSEYFRVLKKGEKIEADEQKLGWAVSEDGKVSAALHLLQTTL